MSGKPLASLTADERAFQTKVENLAREAGWKIQHTYRGRAGKGGAWRTNAAVGFPDLLLLKAGRLVVLELKMPGNEPTPAQNEWLALFQTLGDRCEAYAVWPAHWEQIVELLTE